MNHSGKLMLVVLAACIAFTTRAALTQDTSSLPYLNPKLSPEERAKDPVHRMTLEEKASQLVNEAQAIPRLNVPAYNWWSEALHGVIDQGVTEFPEPIGLAATFDVPAVHTMATDIGIEGRIKHVQDVHAETRPHFINRGTQIAWSEEDEIDRNCNTASGEYLLCAG
jgi:beta-glucosidase